MAEITLDDISLSFSEKPLLDGVNASIFNGDKIALLEEMVRENQL